MDNDMALVPILSQLWLCDPALCCGHDSSQLHTHRVGVPETTYSSR